MDPTDIQAGRELAGRYKLVSLLGQGGMGSVWRAEHLSLGSEVAVKLIDPAIAKNEQARERFVREARAAAKLRSPHVVQILDYGVDGDVPFIVMELLRGESLASRLERLGRLSAEETARIMSEVARALTRAHEAGVVHRDLKPDNVFLNENDDTEVAKVLDFGVARIEQFSAENAGMTSTGAVLGTPYYMSPEQAEGSKTMDHRTDIWALSVMTYECVLGMRPFGGETLGALFVSICSREIPVPSSVRPVPKGFDEWFAKGTARVVSERFSTAREAAQALREVCQIADVDRESALPGAAANTARIGSSADVTGSMLGVDSEESAQIAPSTPGLAHTALEIPGARKSSTLPWILGAVAAVGVIVGVYSMSGDDEQAEGELEPIVVGAPSKDAPADDKAEAKEQDEPESATLPAEEKEKDVTDVAEPAPAPVPASAPQAAPTPEPTPKPSAPTAPVVKTAPATQPRTAPAPAPRPAPAPAPAPAPRPAPAPKPKRVNLGI